MDEGLKAALQCLLWEGFEQGEAEHDTSPYSGDPDDVGVIPDDVVAEVAEMWRAFIAGATPFLESLDLQKPHHRWSDRTLVGHDWVLSSKRHGEGFWDRDFDDVHSLTTGAMLHHLAAEDHPCPEVGFETVGGRWFSG